MSVTYRTSAERVLAALKLTGMAAAALSFVMMLALTGCPTDSGTDSESPVKFTVTFNANGGTVAPASVEVETGKTAALPTPANATAGQNVFQGWYTEDGSGNTWGSRFTNATPVTANITVYARWGAAALQQCTVTFDSQDGSAVPSVTVNEDDKLGTLPQPTKANYTLSGWFTEANGGGTKFTGETPVTASITLYAKWTAAPSGGGKSKLTITDIPEELKDKYVFARALQGEFWGLAGNPMSTLPSLKAVKITSTTVVIPLWTTADGQSWAAYEGNESKTVELFIGDSESVPSNNMQGWTNEILTSSSAITFANGSATAEASLFFGGGGDGVPHGELAAYLETLAAKDAEHPNTVKIAAVNISTGGVMGAINTAVLAKKKFVTLDLSACSATGDEISGHYNPGSDHMNVIRDNQYIVGITLPDNLTKIGDYALRGCKSFTSVPIPSKVTSIGGGAFMECRSLTSVTIPGGVIEIGNDAFSGCPSLSFSIDGTDSSYSIRDGGKMLFKGTELISYPSANGTVTLSNVTSIGSTAFSWCTNLVSVTIPSTVTSIGNAAFWHNTSLTSVTIPSSVGSIGNNAFYGCSSLTGIELPGTITSIGANAFSECSSLTEVTIPGSVASIGNSAFSGCSSLARVTLPSSVGSIGISAFPGDLRTKYWAGGGGAGTYTTTRQLGDNTTATWTKTPQ